MRVLALEPYDGGSHRAFLIGWSEVSRHRWTILGLPPFKWRWRMRHAPLTFARRIRRRWSEGERWDLLWASSMLDLAQLRGLAPEVASLPAVLYFHENQLTYPLSSAVGESARRRDLHFAFSHLTSALAAEAVWFNSAFHRDDWSGATEALIRRMPDHRPLAEIEEIRRRSVVQAPGIPAIAGRLQPSPGPTSGGPLTLLWVARWEHDKGPEVFFEAVERALAAGADLRLVVLGESFERRPAVFGRARKRLAEHILHWGWLESREDYEAGLRLGDVVVSTARHEFFGLGVLEAAAAGARPLLPRRLAYPEIFGPLGDDLFYQASGEGEAGALAERLAALAAGDASLRQPPIGQRARVEEYFWSRRGAAMDEALESLVD
ncbi:MAG: DUF3524 domain-containing protein [Acidobacteriota bacterium]